MPYKKYPVLALTLRPREGIDSEDLNAFLYLSEKYAKQWCIITHKSDNERHIHAVWFLKEERQVSDISGKKKPLGTKFFQKWCELGGSVWEVAVKVKNCYNDDWFTEYLEDEKPGDAPRVIVSNTVKMSKQQRMDIYIDTQPKANRHVQNPEMEKWERMFKEDYPDISNPTVGDIEEFFTQHYYIKRDLKIVKDPRKFKSECHHLRKFISKESGYPWHNGTVMAEYYEG